MRWGSNASAANEREEEMARHQFVALTVGAAFLSASLNASAYNWETHSAIVGRAVGIMQTKPSNAIPPPPDVAEAQWHAYLELVRDAPDRLSLMRTGLPNSLPGGYHGLNHPQPKGEPYPFDTEADTSSCGFYPGDNLTNLDAFRIREFPYEPRRTANPCGLYITEAPGFAPLQAVLGWHAASVDDHVQDTVLWFRPTNAGVAGAIKEAASRVFEYAAGALLLPFVCMSSWLQLKRCNVDDAFDLAREYNPVDYFESWLPGFGHLQSSEYTGLWHFLHVEPDTAHRYNDIRGMWYEGAGPGSRPGFMDVVLMATSDLSGLSLNAYSSRGDDQYGQYDRVARLEPAWQAHTIGHLEFSPVSNLALYGWNEFAKDGYKSARGLAWPLHAIGDVSAPHHVVGTTSWGHRPYEDFAEKYWSKMIGHSDDQRRRILANSYGYWQKLLSRDVGEYVKELALETREKVRAQGDWAYNDYASFDYHLAANGPGSAINRYKGFEDEIAGLLEQAISATLGFLVYTADRVRDPGIDAATKCPSGTHYEPAQGCQPGPGKQPVIEPADVLMDDELPETDGGICESGMFCNPEEPCPSWHWCSNSCCIPLPR